MFQQGGLGRFARGPPSKKKDANGETTATTGNTGTTIAPASVEASTKKNNDLMNISTDMSVMDSNSWMSYNDFDLPVSFDGGPNDMNLDMSSFTTPTTTMMDESSPAAASGVVDVSTMESFSFLDQPLQPPQPDSKTPTTATATAHKETLAPSGAANATSSGTTGGLRLRMFRKNAPAGGPPAASTFSQTQDESSDNHDVSKTADPAIAKKEDASDPCQRTPDYPNVCSLPFKTPAVLPPPLPHTTPNTTDPNATPTGGSSSPQQEEVQDSQTQEQPMELDALPSKEQNKNVVQPDSFTLNVADPSIDKTATAVADVLRQEQSKGVAFLPAESFETDHQHVRIIPGLTPMSTHRRPTVTPGDTKYIPSTNNPSTLSRTPLGTAAAATSTATTTVSTGTSVNHQETKSPFAPRTPGPPLPQGGGLIDNNKIKQASVSATPQDSNHSRFPSVVVTPSDRQPSRLLQTTEGPPQDELKDVNIQETAPESVHKDTTAMEETQDSAILDDQAEWTFEDNYAQFLMDIRDLSDLQENNHSKLREMQGDFATAYAETLQDQAKLLDLVSQFEGIAVVTEELMRDVSITESPVVG
eukprot:Nitzschia sp. Nitz4//scaffold220_size35126//13598//15358//NITZ4_007831-RA/size35126-processed-gene-0.16-mRNA-1//-1//CDS//3329542532//6125//frame0